MTGEGFAAYTQKVSVKGRESVKLMTGFLAGMNYAAGDVHPGVLLIGDVNRDGVINEGDRAALMEAIESGDAAGLAADLNRDGKIDLADLEYFTKGYNENRDILAKIQSSVPTVAVGPDGTEAATVAAKPISGANMTVEGDLNALVQGDGSVTLKTSDGGI